MFDSRAPNAYKATGVEFNDARRARQDVVPTSGPDNYMRACETRDAQLDRFPVRRMEATDEMMSLFYRPTANGWESHPDMYFPNIGHEEVEHNLTVHQLAARIPTGRENLALELYRLIRDFRHVHDSQVIFIFLRHIETFINRFTNNLKPFYIFSFGLQFVTCRENVRMPALGKFSVRIPTAITASIFPGK